MKKFAQLLGQHIATSGLKQTHIASSAGISYNYLQRLASGGRNPSDQVAYKLAQVLNLSAEQTGELLASAGFAPPIALLQGTGDQELTNRSLSSPQEINQGTKLTQQFYRLAQDIPEGLQTSFQEEMKLFLGYARYKYILSGGASLLDFEVNLSTELTENGYKQAGNNHKAGQQTQLYLDLIAQLVGELHTEPEEERVSLTEEDTSQPPKAIDDMLSAIDQLTGNILAGKITLGSFQSQLIGQTFEALREGAPWEIRRRIAEALPGLCQLDISGAERLMEALRLDFDDVRGADIRRRVIEALPDLYDASPQSLPLIVRLLRPKEGDDSYVALATAEVCGDIQAKVKQMLSNKSTTVIYDDPTEAETFNAILQQGQTEIARVQRQLLAAWDGAERESLQFSMALHNLLCAPDTLLISLQEGLQSTDKFMKYVAARYLERVLPFRPIETLELYKELLRTANKRNIRRTVAKALPSLLKCLKESSLSVRALVRDVVSNLALDPDIYIRRAVADHAMQILSIDREFLLILLRYLHKDTDQAIRHRLQPVALRLAQVWLTWYAETAGLIDTKRNRKSLAPFGE